MSEKPEGNFGKIYDSPPDTIQQALDADAARETPRSYSPGPRSGRSGRVELIAKADPRVLEVAQMIMAEGNVFPEYHPDGSMTLHNKQD